MLLLRAADSARLTTDLVESTIVQIVDRYRREGTIQYSVLIDVLVDLWVADERDARGQIESALNRVQAAKDSRALQGFVRAVREVLDARLSTRGSSPPRQPCPGTESDIVWSRGPQESWTAYENRIVLAVRCGSSQEAILRNVAADDCHDLDGEVIRQGCLETGLGLIQDAGINVTLEDIVASRGEPERLWAILGQDRGILKRGARRAATGRGTYSSMYFELLRRWLRRGMPTPGAWVSRLDEKDARPLKAFTPPGKWSAWADIIEVCYAASG